MHIQQQMGNGTESEWARAMRTIFPMDDRAFEYLTMQPVEIQETAVMSFRPRQDGDPDYSGAITSFIKRIRQQGSVDGGRSFRHVPPGLAPTPLLDAFRRRYPVDDRAWDFLCQCHPASIRNVVETFKPKMEGEADYSGLLTSFVKRAR